MEEKTVRFHFFKHVKLLLIILPINLLIGLIYCLVREKMTIVSYSDVLLIIGGVFAGIGGLSYVGGENIGTANKMLISRDSSPRKTEGTNDTNFNTTILLAGISTILISYM